jgi:hypothetical protein
MVTAVGPGVTAHAETATLQIIHVYSGDTRLVGKTFIDRYSDRDRTGRLAGSPFKVGEEGIWSLAYIKKQLVPAVDDRLPFLFRSREVDNKRHKQIVALAEAIEKYVNEKPLLRFDLAKNLTKNSTPAVSAWAVRKISDSDTKAADEFLNALAANPNITRAGQVALDEVMSKRHADDWFTSKDREKLLRSWVTGKADEYDAATTLRRLDTARQTRELPYKLASELCRTAATNKGWPWEVRRNVVFLIGQLTKDRFDEGAGYDWLIERIKSGDDIEMRRTAAIVIRHVPLNPDRLKTVQGLLEKESDQEVAKWLREATQKAR